MNRREWLAAGLFVPAAQAAAVPTFPQEKVDALDRSVDQYIERQILDRSHRYYGSYATDEGLFHGSVPASLIDGFLAALLLPQSKHYKSARVAERMQIAAQAFGRLQTPDGNWNNPITNFNSPADSSFILQGMTVTLLNARRYGFPDLEKWLLPAMQKAGGAQVRGGMHKPNHRWVACSALAGLYKLYGEAKYLRRAEQWLAESIDIDADGQYTERSTIGYNGICNRALTLVAEWLNKPEYLEPVRRNLNASLYLLHADGEVVTEISTRQDLNERGTLFNHWFPLLYLAAKDRNGVLATLAREFLPRYGSLSWLMQWPDLTSQLPPDQPLPDNYAKIFPSIGLARIRRGPTSISLLRDHDRFFTYRHGAVVINAIRFSSAFFGKAQFTPQTLRGQNGRIVLTQQLDAGYYQPFEPTRKVTTATYDSTRHQRRRTEICTLSYTATFTETSNGCTLRIQATGTDEVPLTVEINLRENTDISGAEKVGRYKDVWLLREGFAEVTSAGSKVRIGPGVGSHGYLEVRGALPRLDGPSIFLTAFTPFDHTINIANIS
jgi:hypothetical protein